MDDKKQIVRWFKDVVPTKIEWLWFPYIPCGKITILQGEPGCGKVVMMINIITKLTMGDTLPDGRRIDPINVIYLCKEDRWVDVIRPMLESTNANMERVVHLMEDSLNNDLPKDVAIGFNARLLVIDSFHDFVNKTDLVNTVRARSIMKRISGWAAANQCAVVLIENLNEKKRKKICIAVLEA